LRLALHIAHWDRKGAGPPEKKMSRLRNPGGFECGSRTFLNDFFKYLVSLFQNLNVFEKALFYIINMTRCGGMGHIGIPR
jgi:hypothetical protein